MFKVVHIIILKGAAKPEREEEKETEAPVEPQPEKKNIGDAENKFSNGCRIFDVAFQYSLCIGVGTCVLLLQYFFYLSLS